MIEKMRRIIAAYQGPQALGVAYKISYDILFLLILTFIAALFLEALLPGMVSQNNGFIIISFLIFGAIWTINLLSQKLEIEFIQNRKHHLFPFALVGSFILIGNSLLKFALWENLLITTITLFVFFLLYHAIFPDRK